MKIGCSEVPKPTYPSLLWPAEWKASAPLFYFLSSAKDTNSKNKRTSNQYNAHHSKVHTQTFFFHLYSPISAFSMVRSFPENVFILRKLNSIFVRWSCMKLLLSGFLREKKLCETDQLINWSTDQLIYWSSDLLIYWSTDQGQTVAWRIVRYTPYPGENSR